MNKILPVAFSVFIIFLTSCNKLIDERIQGDWRLDKSYKKDFLSRDYFQTGYEEGIFTFYENGTAGYTSLTDTLMGYWEAGFYTTYNGNGDGKREKFLRINLVNYQTNRLFVLDLDEFHYKNGYHCIKGTEHSYGRDRVYEFVRP